MGGSSSRISTLTRAELQATATAAPIATATMKMMNSYLPITSRGIPPKTFGDDVSVRRLDVVHKSVMGADIFGGKAYVAPNAHKQRLNNIRAACEEVALQWPTIEPPHGPSAKLLQGVSSG
jgi:hypothetical protein